MKIDNYIPDFVYKNVYEIDYKNIKNQDGEKFQYIFYDLDNTLCPYTEDMPSDPLIELIRNVEGLGYIVLIVSNSPEKRVKKFAEALGVDYLYRANKPSYSKTLGLINDLKTFKPYVLLVGDQLVTDICCANKLGVTSIYVPSVNRSTQHWYTKINRIREKRILNKIEKVNFEKFQEIKGEK